MIVKKKLRVGAVELPFVLGEFAEVVSVLRKPVEKKSIVIMPTSLNDLAMISSSPLLADAYRQVDICTTDGMPLVWWFRRRTGNSVDRVYGPDIIKLLIEEEQASKQLILCALEEDVASLTQRYVKEIQDGKKKIELIGSVHDKNEHSRIAHIVDQFKPRFVWMGIGSPNQVILASSLKTLATHYCSYFCVGVGVQFLAETVKQAPSWWQVHGLEWLFRLLTEPKRLWKRYLVIIPRYLLGIMKEWITAPFGRSIS